MVVALVEILVVEEWGVGKGVVLGCSRDIWDPGGFALDSNVFVLLFVPAWGALPSSLFWAMGLSWREALELLALVWLGFECGLIVLFTPLLLIEG
ncbi:hypothetical protein SUGI_0659800 [Cryptomeria japonica]|nr:hypothetical protein SUGI_0659800 [Cryptomeria japonica]